MNDLYIDVCINIVYSNKPTDKVVRWSLQKSTAMQRGRTGTVHQCNPLQPDKLSTRLVCPMHGMMQVRYAQNAALQCPALAVTSTPQKQMHLAVLKYKPLPDARTMTRMPMATLIHNLWCNNNTPQKRVQTKEKLVNSTLGAPMTRQAPLCPHMIHTKKQRR